MSVCIINVGFLFMARALLYIVLGVVIIRTFPGLLKGVKKKHTETLNIICLIIGVALVLGGILNLFRIIEI